MNGTEREYFITKLAELQETISKVEKWLTTYGYHCDFTNSKPPIDEIRKHIQLVKRTKLGVESQLATGLPLTIEGYVGEDEEEVDHDEHGRIMEVFHYLGCPVFPTEHNRHYGVVQYDKFKDLTEIFKMHAGKFIKVSIEEVPLGEGNHCGNCDNRFKCLTTKVIA